MKTKRICELKKGDTNRLRRQSFELMGIKQQIFTDDVEDNFIKYGFLPGRPVCSVFGCGRELTLRESLFGETCNKHPRLSPDCGYDQR